MPPSSEKVSEWWTKEEEQGEKETKKREITNGLILDIALKIFRGAFSMANLIIQQTQSD